MVLIILSGMIGLVALIEVAIVIIHLDPRRWREMPLFGTKSNKTTKL
jgi:hypothetical protein